MKLHFINLDNKNMVVDIVQKSVDILIKKYMIISKKMDVNY